MLIALIVAGGVAAFYLRNYLNKLNAIEPVTTEIKAEKLTTNGFRIQLIQTITMKVPGGSMLVIPLIPIPIAKKEKVVNHFIEVQDGNGKTVMKLHSLNLVSGQIKSIDELEVSKKIEALYALEKIEESPDYAPNMAILSVYKDLPFEIKDLVKFAQENREQIIKTFNVPIGLIVKYALKEEPIFKSNVMVGTSLQIPWFTFRGLYMSFYIAPEDRERLQKIELSIKLKKTEQGLIDLSAVPEIDENLNQVQKDFLLKNYRNLDLFKSSEDGLPFRTYINQANQAFLKK